MELQDISNEHESKFKYDYVYVLPAQPGSHQIKTCFNQIWITINLLSCVGIRSYGIMESLSNNEFTHYIYKKTKHINKYL